MRGSGLVAGGFAGALACGPGLPPGGADGSSEGTGASAGPDTAAVPTDGGSDENGEADTTAAPTTGSDESTGGPPPARPEACALALVPGDARVAIDASQAFGTLRLTVLDPGAPGTPARVLAVQHEILGNSHGEYRARSFALNAWPDDVAELGGSLSLTRDGHSVSRLAPLADGAHTFAYVFTGDPRGLNVYDTFFAVLDADAWSIGGEVELARGTNSGTVDLLPTASSARLLATFMTDDFDAVPKGEISGLSLGLLDPAGATLAGPAPLTPTTPSPGNELRTFWSGDRVAAAIGANACAAADPLCDPHAVVLARPTAIDEHGAAIDGFVADVVVPGLESTQYVSRPALTNAFGLTWAIWYEGTDENSSDEHRTLRGMVLDAAGVPLPWPPDAPTSTVFEMLPDTAMASWPNVHVSEFGITAAFRTADTTFEIHHHDFAFQPLGPPIVVALDSANAHNPGMAALADPRSLLLAWTEDVAGDLTVRMARLACAP